MEKEIIIEDGFTLLALRLLTVFSVLLAAVSLWASPTNLITVCIVLIAAVVVILNWSIKVKK